MTICHLNEAQKMHKIQFMIIGNSRSSEHDLNIGVSQGSGLGHILFLLYIAPLANIFRNHGLRHHGYADDTQVYCSVPRGEADRENAISNVNACLEEVKNWMVNNKLRLNDAKTECITFRCSKKANDQLGTITVGDADIQPSECVRNLGAYLDKDLSMKQHVSAIIRSAYFHLRRIAKIRRHLTHEACTKAVISTVTSRIDFHNALLVGSTQALRKRLQVVQNNCARLVTGTPRMAHMQPVLKQQHWLPIDQRITYKCALIVHKSLHQAGSPSYINEVIIRHNPTRSLRSMDSSLLVVPRTKKRIGDSGFYAHGPKIWNELPVFIRKIENLNCFKKHLKTHLFCIAFD